MTLGAYQQIAQSLSDFGGSGYSEQLTTRFATRSDLISTVASARWSSVDNHSWTVSTVSPISRARKPLKRFLHFSEAHDHRAEATVLMRSLCAA